MLVQLDTRQEQAQLAAAEAQLRARAAELRAHAGAGRAGRGLAGRVRRAPRPRTSRRRRGCGEIRATIERKTIRAPFSGVLGIRQVNLGQYLTGGDPVVPLQSLDPDLRELRRAAAGRRADARRPQGARSPSANSAAPSSRAASRAVDSVVDEATRNVQVQATLANPGGTAAAGHVRPGAGRRSAPSQPVVALPASAISYAPYGDSVFVVDRPEGPEGADLPRRAPAVREARAARAATRSRCSPASSRARKSSPRACSSCATAPPSR